VTTPLVSVIIPTFNRSDLLQLTLESVRAQTLEDFEVIVVDDGSTDNTREVVESFDQRFRYVYQVKGGRSRARNRALGLARGRYVAFLDSDDLFFPNKLELQAQRLTDHPEAGWIYSATRNIDDDGRDRGHGYEASVCGCVYPEVALYIPVTVILSTVMVRREVLDAVGGFDEDMDRFEDVDMWRRISRRYEVLAVSEPLIGFRAHAGNTMEHPLEVYRSASSYVRKVLREDADLDLDVLRHLAAAFLLHYGMAVWSRPGSRRYSRPFLRESLRLEPGQPDVARWLLATYVGTWILSVDWWLRHFGELVSRRLTPERLRP
jgi:glycosyltransferase involved in cell wall biosynthesis